MNDIQYKIITNPSDPMLSDVESMFRDLYDHLTGKGQMNPLVKEGEKMWIISIKNTLNKLGIIFVAVSGDEVIGFINGQIRFLPNFLGGEKTGFLAHQFMRKKYRGMGIGEKLLQHLEEWFVKKGIKQMELYVNCDNDVAKEFYIHSGFENEWVQMRKFLR